MPLSPHATEHWRRAIFVGYDAADRPTRIVVDFFLLHRDWPGALE